MPATITKPTEAEVDAAEKVLAEGFDPAGLIEADGYWRPLAEDTLVAADEAGRGKALEDALDTLYAIMMMDAGGASERAAETYHNLRGLTLEAAESPSVTQIGSVYQLDAAIAADQARDRAVQR